ncbi:SpoIIIJ-associated RNA/ssDNA-binding protein [Carnobacterium sp. 17-4]|uniref:RNA-binding cell elongation regulator Jag/EloR n=1 Tax=Carnobacterium sp. (strain 17-4) TaxID=208596 RepID=UPI0002058478|nr:RNA-binding cell elongation regulator Jag/EloR [Carnobacterium sp. 17-4]AEB31169.1 SpoIIIJ-associated RNA/ssDNA-binding protein [Carnobacterium sp. 17-4]
MDKYTAQAETIEEATQKALKKLGITKKEASIEIIDPGRKGIFKIGKKDAVVTITKIAVGSNTKEVFQETAIKEETFSPSSDSIQVETGQEEAPILSEVNHLETDHLSTAINTERNDEQAIKMVADYLQDITQKMGISSTIMVEETKDQVVFHIETEKAGLIIGKHGKVLNALQSLAQVLLHRHAKTKFSAVVNVGDYRERRENALRELAERTALKVRRTKQPVFLEPMPASERKQIHFYLSKDDSVITHSEGNEPHRYLVVESK